MKSLMLSTLILFCTITSTFAQDTWLQLKYPESNILGKAVVGFKKGVIDYSLTNPGLANPKLDTTQSADNIEEYNKKFRSFITKYFTSTNQSVREVKAHKLVITKLNSSSILAMKNGSYYVSSALSADSVTITVKVKKAREADVSKVIKAASSLITNAAVAGIANNIIPLLDSITYKSEDSIAYKMVLRNPNVYYQVKIVALTKDNRDWEKYCKLFSVSVDPDSLQMKNKLISDSQRLITNNDLHSTSKFNLVYAPIGYKHQTLALYPEFWGKDDKSMLFKLVCTKRNDSLQLSIAFTTGEMNGAWTMKELTPKIENGQRFWKLDRSLIHYFDRGKITKMIYITLQAQEVDKNTITIYNHENQNLMSYMQYPAYKFKYLKFKN